MKHLCNNPNEWIEPEKFIPERFDPHSKYYLTPSGIKRNPYSFSPFLGGNRVCIGKTFAESINKLVIPTLLTNFEWNLPKGMNKDDLIYPYNNILTTQAPTVYVEIKDRHLKYTAK